MRFYPRSFARPSARGAMFAALTISGGQLSLDELPPAFTSDRVTVQSSDVVPMEITREAFARRGVPLLAVPGAADPLVMRVAGAWRSVVVGEARIPRIEVGPRRYANLVAWRPTAATPERRRTVVLLGVAIACTLLLARLLPRRAWMAVGAVGLAWVLALGVAVGRRQTLFTRDEAGTRWISTLVPRTLRVPIREGEPWVPVVESLRQLEMLGPRITVDADGATLELTLTARAKLLLLPSPP